jgi:glycerophosphoryl diester phosphodiesterase
VFLHVPPPSRLKALKDYGVDIEADVIQWIREGQLDQLISNDVAQVARLKDAARG